MHVLLWNDSAVWKKSQRIRWDGCECHSKWMLIFTNWTPTAVFIPETVTNTATVFQILTTIRTSRSLDFSDSHLITRDAAQLQSSHVQGSISRPALRLSTTSSRSSQPRAVTVQRPLGLCLSGRLLQRPIWRREDTNMPRKAWTYGELTYHYLSSFPVWPAINLSRAAAWLVQCRISSPGMRTEPKSAGPLIVNDCSCITEMVLFVHMTEKLFDGRGFRDDLISQSPRCLAAGWSMQYVTIRCVGTVWCKWPWARPAVLLRSSTAHVLQKPQRTFCKTAICSPFSQCFIRAHIQMSSLLPVHPPRASLTCDGPVTTKTSRDCSSSALTPHKKQVSKLWQSKKKKERLQWSDRKLHYVAGIKQVFFTLVINELLWISI